MRITPVTALAGITLLWATAFAQDGNATSPKGQTGSLTETISETPVRQESLKKAEMASSLATRALLDIASARSALKAKDTTQAKAELDKAQSQFKVIQNDLPEARIKDDIAIARQHLNYESSAMVEPDLIPIYGEVDQFVEAPKRSKFRAMIDRVKHFLKIGKKQQAATQLKGLEDALVVANVSLPLNETQAAVEQAQQRLAKNDPAGADAALARAESNLRVSVSALVTPARPATKTGR